MLEEKFPVLVPLKEVCKVENITWNVNPDKVYNYLEVPDISEATGVITNIRRLKGSDLNQSSFHQFFSGDILFTRINPRKSRIAIAPPVEEYGIVSKEVYRIVWKENPYIPIDHRYVLCAILKSTHVHNQVVRLSTGSSSSRARVQEDDLLNDVYIPIPSEEHQKEINDSLVDTTKEIWECSQRYLRTYTNNQLLLGTEIRIDDLRGV